MWRIATFLQRVKESEVVELPNGFPLLVNSRDWISKTIYEGTYERALLHLLDGLTISDASIDVGANIGVTLWHSLSRSAPSATFIAFEPSPQCFEALSLTRAHISREGKIFEFAIGDADETRTMYGLDNQAHSGAASLTSHSGLRGGQGEVRVCKLDTVLSQELGARSVSLLKIDTEGYEAQVVNGAKEILHSGKIGMIVMEVSPNFGSVDYLETVYDLLNNKYTWFILGERGSLKRVAFLQEISLTRALAHDQQWNLVLVRKDVLEGYRKSQNSIAMEFLV